MLLLPKLPSHVLKRDLTILFGNAFDHFDIAIYSFLAPVIGLEFFPNHDPMVQLILTYALLLTTIITQPIGAYLFGNFARIKGPNCSLRYSLMGVAITTFLIGVLPGYNTLGWLAPAFLTLIRSIRGVAAAGETTVAKLYILEGKTLSEEMKASYLYQSSTMVGVVIASGLSALVISFYPQAWRACFIFGGLTGLAAYFLRRSLTASDVNEGTEAVVSRGEVFSAYGFSALKSMWTHRAALFRVAFADVFGHVTYVVPFVFMNTFVPMITKISLETMMGVNTALLVLDVVLIPVLGPIVARFDPVKILLFSSSILSVTLVPLFHAMPGASLPYVIFVRIWILVWGVVFLCPLNLWCKNLFDTPDKYFLVGMGGAMGAGTLGRTLTPVFLWLWYVSSSAAMPAAYMTLLTATTAFLVYTSAKPATQNVSLVSVPSPSQS